MNLKFRYHPAVDAAEKGTNNNSDEQGHKKGQLSQFGEEEGGVVGPLQQRGGYDRRESHGPSQGKVGALEDDDARHTVGQDQPHR